MEIQTLTLRNFRGIKELTVNFDGKNAIVYGRNGTGKSTAANAIQWLLAGKVDGEKGFTPKTREKDGEVHGMTHSADVTVSSPLGQFTFEKKYREKWTKQNGATEAEFAGHTTDYFIDGIPVKEKEYLAKCADILGDPARYRLLTNPQEFAVNIGWEDRRRILIDVCGDVTDEDVIESDKELEALPLILTVPNGKGRMYTIDEYATIAVSKLRDIRKEKEKKPIQINEAERLLKEFVNDPPADIEKELSALEADIKRLDGEIAIVKAGGVKSNNETIEAANRLNVELHEARTRYYKEFDEKNKNVRERIASLEQEKTKARIEAQRAEDEREKLKREYSKLNDMRTELLEKRNALRLLKFEPPKAAVCSTCNRPFENTFDLAQLEADFNERRANNLEAVSKEGKKNCSKEMIEAKSEEIDGVSKRLAIYMAAQESAQKQIDELRKSEVSPPSFELTDEYTAIAARKKALEENDVRERAETERQSAETVGRLSEQRHAMATRRNELLEIKGKIAQADEQAARVVELREELRKLAIEDEKLQRHVRICELFDTKKMSMINDKINDRFKAVNFRMFVKQINGGMKKDCEVLVPDGKGNWIPYSGGSNKGANLAAGLEIINVLSNYYGEKYPIIIDDAERLSKGTLPEVEAQVIQFKVTDDDRVLRVELLGEKPKNIRPIGELKTEGEDDGF